MSLFTVTLSISENINFFRPLVAGKLSIDLFLQSHVVDQDSRVQSLLLHKNIISETLSYIAEHQRIR